MKIFVVGATGRVGQELIRNLVDQNHQIVAGARSPEKIISNNNVTPIRINLHDDVEILSQIIKDVDVIYFVAGSRNKDLLQTDAFGAVKIMQVAKINRISRFIMLSSAFSLEPNKWNNPAMASLLNYNIAKFFADNYLVNQTELNYTILQATALVEIPGTHKISLNDEANTTNSIQNVGATLAELLNYNQTINQIIKMSDGDTPISDAFKHIT
ncbi:oxidoreductase [Leuconostoc litchii]|uniref:NAD-dependent epimerase/dehydratase family protein n=1 Tax=Leuconostoc litchii TaxID=1981069 RepID=A0A6P2CLY0_9LACO|nr:NAD(P)H-binding protein [Leuconostoc litchii]TYC47038.1 NAD-dependent epimerase/dehydratase family protein [Leuconostoc litchii]GMA68962.1 oxidoreductase [Leuconostoc litchii]